MSGLSYYESPINLKSAICWFQVYFLPAQATKAFGKYGPAVVARSVENKP